MVKKVAELEKERLLLTRQKVQILEGVVLKINKDMEKLRVKLQPYIDSWRSIIQLYNPKKEFTLSLRLEYETYNLNIQWNKEDITKKPFINVNFNKVPLYLDFGDCQDYNCIEPNNGFYAPIKFKKVYEVSEDYITFCNRLNKIDNLLRNKSALQEQIIAKVTENALMQSSELKLLAEQVKLDI